MDTLTILAIGGFAVTVARLLWVELRGSKRADRSQELVELDTLNSALTKELERRNLISQTDLERAEKRCNDELQDQARMFMRVIDRIPGGTDAIANEPRLLRIIEGGTV